MRTHMHTFHCQDLHLAHLTCCHTLQRLYLGRSHLRRFDDDFFFNLWTNTSAVMQQAVSASGSTISSTTSMWAMGNDFSAAGRSAACGMPSYARHMYACGDVPWMLVCLSSAQGVCF